MPEFLKAVRTTKRVYGVDLVEGYYSLCLPLVSVQAVGWVLATIEADRLEPNESLVHSRLKEYFGVRAAMKDWKAFVFACATDRDLMRTLNKYSDILGELTFHKLMDQPCLIYPTIASWPYEDLDQILETQADYQ